MPGLAEWQKKSWQWTLWEAGDVGEYVCACKSSRGHVNEFVHWVQRGVRSVMFRQLAVCQGGLYGVEDSAEAPFD